MTGGTQYNLYNVHKRARGGEEKNLKKAKMGVLNSCIGTCDLNNREHFFLYKLTYLNKLPMDVRLPIPVLYDGVFSPGCGG